MQTRVGRRRGAKSVPLPCTQPWLLTLVSYKNVLRSDNFVEGFSEQCPPMAAPALGLSGQSSSKSRSVLLPNLALSQRHHTQPAPSSSVKPATPWPPPRPRAVSAPRYAARPPARPARACMPRCYLLCGSQALSFSRPLGVKVEHAVQNLTAPTVLSATRPRRPRRRRLLRVRRARHLRLSTTPSSRCL